MRKGLPQQLSAWNLYRGDLVRFPKKKESFFEMVLSITMVFCPMQMMTADDEKKHFFLNFIYQILLNIHMHIVASLTHDTDGCEDIEDKKKRMF